MLQKLNKKLSRNQKGFSLIELMVAVTILALAAFGIFQAFTAGFMGMTDAKERTIATNFAQKIMEDIRSKNAINVTGGYQVDPISGKTYDISVNPYEQDEKTYVTVTVSWPDRNGNTKHVDLETVFYDLDTVYVAADIGEIVLTSEVYPVTCCDDVPMIATVTDPVGNPVVDGVAVLFSLEAGEGEFSPYLVPTKNGIAEVTLSLIPESGSYVDVLASSGGVESNLLHIDINVPYLEIEAVPESIAICEESVVTATLRTSLNGVPIAGKRINFTSDGLGEILSRNYNITDAEGKARVSVYSESIINYGTNVYAAYCCTEAMPPVNIIFAEPNFSIEAVPSSLAICQESTITVTLLRNDGNDTPVSGAELEFTANSGGTLSSSTAVTNENGQAQVTLSSNSAITTSVTAEYCKKTVSTTDIIFTEPTIELTANPMSIPAGGSSTITATVTDSSNNTVPDGTEIFFAVLAGSGILSPESAITTSGQAQVTVQHSNIEDSNTIKVQATYCGVSSNEVTFVF